MKTKVILSLLCLLTTGSMEAQRIDLSAISTEYEAELEIKQMTTNEDEDSPIHPLAMPILTAFALQRRRDGAMRKDGQTVNIMISHISK